MQAVACRRIGNSKSRDLGKMLGRLFFTQRTVRLPREVVGAPSLEAFRARLAEALSSLIWCVTTLPKARGLELDGLYGPLQHKPFCDFVNGL